MQVEISQEAERLRVAMQTSPVAFSYFDAEDRLALWNSAYEDLNFRIGHLIQKGARFPDLLAELVIEGQIEIAGDVQDWVDSRLRARRMGRTSFRNLSDGRTFLVQERRDEIGGTLGFWIDVSDLVRSGALQSVPTDVPGQEFRGPVNTNQNFIRHQLETIVSNLELLSETIDPSMRPFLSDALTAAETIEAALAILPSQTD